MVSVNPTGGNEPVIGSGKLNNTENIENKENKGNIWEQYDDAEYGEKGTVDKHEVYKLVKDNMPPTVGISRTVNRFNGALEALEKFVGNKWNEDTYNKMITTLTDFFNNNAEKDIKDFNGLAE